MRNTRTNNTVTIKFDWIMYWSAVKTTRRCGSYKFKSNHRQTFPVGFFFCRLLSFLPFSLCVRSIRQPFDSICSWYAKEAPVVKSNKFSAYNREDGFFFCYDYYLICMRETARNNRSNESGVCNFFTNDRTDESTQLFRFKNVQGLANKFTSRNSL